MLKNIFETITTLLVKKKKKIIVKNVGMFIINPTKFDFVSYGGPLWRPFWNGKTRPVSVTSQPHGLRKNVVKTQKHFYNAQCLCNNTVYGLTAV